MTKEEKIKNFDLNGVCIDNGNFGGLPFDKEDANIILLPMPWDVTVSYSAGTIDGADAIRTASLQLDFYDADVKDAWKQGIFMPKTSLKWYEKSLEYREKVEEIIHFLELGGKIEENKAIQKTQSFINKKCNAFNKWVYRKTKKLLEEGKLVGLVGGDHSTPLGYLQALAEKHTDGFGILQIDAHCDLRDAYEGFTYSHASIFFNALKMKEIEKLVQVGIRDYCEAEVDLIQNSNGRIVTFFDQAIKEAMYEGKNWSTVCDEIVAALPQKVYISFDIDGLDPKLCPHTGTPVAGGFETTEVNYLFKKVVASGRQIIGFDLSETGNDEWDGNVAARMLYKLCNLAGKELIGN